MIAAPLSPTPRRIWNGIESDDPPPRRHDHAALAACAQAMLDSRRDRFPRMIEAGAIDAAEAARQIAAFEGIVLDWRWICTGEGTPAPESTLPARRAALDQSIHTIADIARERGFTDALADQADLVIALRWHLDPGRQTHACAEMTRAMRRRLAAPAPSPTTTNGDLP